MMRGAILCLSLLYGMAALASSEGGLMKAHVNLSDHKSLQRGARVFVNYCLSCHSAAYMRFNRMGTDLGISDEVLKANLMFGTDKTGDTMTVAMTRDDAKRYFGVAPPDLSVVARARGADWLYSYFMTFYRDPSRPTGVNNLVFKDVAMPHVLWELQGWQRVVMEDVKEPDGSMFQRVNHLELETPGKQKPEEYARTVNDLVNFLVYLGEPAQLKRKAIGGWVLGYLVILFIIVYFMKKEFWRDVH